MIRPRPYLPRQPGDPLVAGDVVEVTRRLLAELGRHDHTGGSRGALLRGDGFDPASDATVARMEVDELQVGDLDLGAELAGLVSRRGGRVRGDLTVSGPTRVQGTLALSPAPVQRALGCCDQAPPSATRREASAGQGRLVELPGAALSLVLEAPALILVQLTGAYTGPIGSWNNSSAQVLPHLLLVAERDGRQAALGQPGSADPSDIDAVLQAAAPLPAEINVGRGDPALTSNSVTGRRPLLLTWLLRAGAGPLRLSLRAWGWGSFSAVVLRATTLPEADDV